MFDLAQLAEADQALTALAHGCKPISSQASAMDVSRAQGEIMPSTPKCPFQRERAA